jgi:Polysaccharide lyase
MTVENLNSSTVDFLDFHHHHRDTILHLPKGGGGSPAGWVQAKEKPREEVPMTYTFKISRRLARLRAPSFAVLAASFLTLSCTDEQSTGPSTLPSESPTGVSVSPNSVLMGPNQALQFQASVDNTSGLLSTSKTGKGRGRTRRSVIGLSVTPHTLTVAEGSAANFSVTGTLADSTTVQPSVTWAATGGVIDANGRFTAGSIPGSFTVSATASSGISDTAAVVVTETVPAPLNVTLSPVSSSLPVGGSERFVATGTSGDGRTVTVGARYAATGGTISADGLYQAGQTPGTFKVIATDTLTSLSDTASVIIEPPPATLQAIVLTPSSASLTAGATQQFTATGKMSDGTTAAVTVSWSASGGSITSGGLYTAGQTAGTFRVIAAESGGLADTAGITISAPIISSPPPSGGSGTTNFLATAETSGSFAPWNYAISDAQDGGSNPKPFSSADRAKNGSRSWEFELTNPSTGTGGTSGGATYSQFLASGPQSSMGSPNGGFTSGYYSFYAYVDAGYNSSAWNMLLGWMTGNGLRTGTHPISHMGLEVHNGVLQVVYVLKSCTSAYACPSIAGYSNGGSPWYLMTPQSPAGIVPFPRNQWVHLSIYYKMAPSNGQVIIWQDGVKIMDLTAPTMNTFGGWDNGLQNAAGDMILQFGTYGPTLPTVQRLYVDDFRVGDYRPAP